jgi:N-acetylneuraminate synthase
LKNRAAARKSLVVSSNIRKGDIFTENNLTVKRPGTGVSPIYYWDWIGKKAEKDYLQDEILKS